MHVTFVVFDEVQIANSKKYRIFYDRLIMSGRTGGGI